MQSEDNHLQLTCYESHLTDNIPAEENK